MKRNNNAIYTYYESTDLHLIATISLFYPIESIDKRDPKRVVFRFAKDDKFDALINRYWNGKLKLDPLRYSQNLKALRNRIHQ